MPDEGPVFVIAAPHGNQFADGILLSQLFPRKLWLIGAKASLEAPVIGFFMRGMNSIIPIDREMDHIKKGVGTITIKGKKVTGKGTNFTTLKTRDFIIYNKKEYRISYFLLFL